MISIRQNKKKLLAVLLIISLALAAALVLNVERADAPDPGSSRLEPKNNAPESKPFDKNKHSIEDPSSIWVVVNKKRPLPDDFAPNDLDGDVRREAGEKLADLMRAAQNDGHGLYKISGFRSQQYQQQVYSSYVARDGQAKADTYSARPGHSEHQTGLAVDVGNGTCDLEVCFGDTPAGRWLADNAYRWGFIIRYQKGKEHITGYQYEPWHLRYVGVELAAQLHSSGQTMEEFFGLPAAPTY